VILATSLILFGLWYWRNPSIDEQPIRFSGSTACAECHSSQFASWLKSNHRHAMEKPAGESVLGDFSGAELRYFGRTTRFSKDGDSFLVHTENQQGQTETFKVAYTLGYRPLQQYLVDIGGGRFQALPFAWDTRSKTEGGQRWFHLYPGENVTPANPLFWTRPLQNWNHMCADCHTTGFTKNFDSDSNSFQSAWSETGNGCESCHGAGSRHIEERRAARTAARSGATITGLKSFQEQIDQCGFCHARRVRLSDPAPHNRMLETMLETWRPQLPREGPYFADGQIRDEVFEIGSFLQSRMALKGVRCSDCHDAHTSGLKFEGNALCTQCHLPETFDVPQHHFHQSSSAGAQCVACHMPTRTYMVVDDRHDHRLGVPQPALSDRLGTPNPCVTCHKNRPNAWAADVVARHLKRNQDVRDSSMPLGIVAWNSAREQKDAADLLSRFVQDATNAPIARAAALSAATATTPELTAIVRLQLASQDALVRLGAVQAAGLLPLTQRVEILINSVRDPSRAVRLEAAGLVAGADEKALTSDQRRDLKAAIDEYRHWLSRDQDRAETLVALAGLQAVTGDTINARSSFERALRNDESSLVTLLNYADFHRAQGDDGSADRLLSRAAALYPDAAAAHFALGLLRVRQKRHAEAATELARAAQLAPDNSSYAYVHAVALYSTGQTSPALSKLSEAGMRFPANLQIRSALAAYCAELRAKDELNDKVLLRICSTE
jgi:predicted CXXCH cytochrome family protein